MSSAEIALLAKDGNGTNGEADSAAAVPNEIEAVSARNRRHRLEGAVVTTAVKLMPLVEVLDAIRPHVTNESVFRTRRKKINAQIALAYEQLKTERPKRKTLVRVFKTMGDLVREESRDVSKDELREAAKELVLATIKNAPAIINAAHQAKLLS